MKRSLRTAAAVVAAVAVIVTGACGKREDGKEQVVRFIDATTVEPHRFRYEVEFAGAEPLVVQGLVADDFARKLQLSIGDKPAVEQVIRDDAVAMRFLDTTIVDGYLDNDVEVDTSTDIEGASVLDALKASRWVLDEAGAPSAVVDLREEVGTRGNDTPARDPLFDARTAMAYVRRTAQRNSFVKYDPDTLNPTYRADEDPFPKPQDGSGVERYDSVLADLPTPAQATSRGTPTFPGEESFRKMAVYVKGGKVIAVREFIGVSKRQLEDFERYIEAVLEASAPEDVVRSFERELDRRRGSDEELAAFLLEGMNTFIVTSGREPIRFRTMSMTLEAGGNALSEIVIPSEVIKGNLAVIRNIGRKPVVKDEQTSRPAVPQDGDSSGASSGTSEASQTSTDQTPTTVAP